MLTITHQACPGNVSDEDVVVRMNENDPQIYATRYVIHDVTDQESQVMYRVQNTSSLLGSQPVHPEVAIRKTPLCLNIAGASLAKLTNSLV